MKIFMLSALLVSALVFTSCGSDDEGTPPVNDCQTCDLTILEQSITSEICDNGDGTVTITTDGGEETESLDGVTFAEFIAAFEAFGATCN